MQYKLYFSAHSKVTSETSHNVFEKCFLQSTHHSLREFSDMLKERIDACTSSGFLWVYQL